MKLWKVLGLAGAAGVAAVGVVVAREERRRRSYTPEEVRLRLHERYSTIGEDSAPPPPSPPSAPRWRRFLRRDR